MMSILLHRKWYDDLWLEEQAPFTFQTRYVLPFWRDPEEMADQTKNELIQAMTSAPESMFQPRIV